MATLWMYLYFDLKRKNLSTSQYPWGTTRYTRPSLQMNGVSFNQGKLKRGKNINIRENILGASSIFLEGDSECIINAMNSEVVFFCWLWPSG